jgi:hypothetical protein
MNAEWIPVYYGSVAEVLVLQETLDANGIPTLAPDVDHMDTATLAGSAYSVRLLVPKDRLELARSLVPESKRHNIPGSGALHAASAAPEELGGEA